MTEPIEFLDHVYIRDNPRAPRPIAIEGIIRVGDLAVITGEYDAYKSTLGLELAWSLATGRPWLKCPAFRVVRKIRTGVLQTEIDPGAYDERCARFPPARDLLLCTSPDFTLDRILELQVALDDAALEGIVIDPLGQVWPSHARNGEPFSENAKSHVSPLMRELKSLRRTVVLIHHDPKPSAGFKGRASGSAAILNDPDVRIFVDRKGDGHIKVTVRNRLQRPAPPFEAIFDPETLRLSVTKEGDDRLSKSKELEEEASVAPPRRSLPSSRFKARRVAAEVGRRNS